MQHIYRIVYAFRKDLIKSKAHQKTINLVKNKGEFYSPSKTGHLGKV